MNGTSAESKFIVGLLLGFAIGAAIAIITAPESGFKTREYIRKKIINTGESVKGAAEELTDKAKDFTEEVSSRVREVAGDREKIYKKTWKQPKTRPYS